MGTWLTSADEALIVELWGDAPVDDPALDIYLDAARVACIAYAPALSGNEGEVSPGPITVGRRNLATNPRVGIDVTRWGGAGGTFTRSPVVIPDAPSITHASVRTGDTLASGTRVYHVVAGSEVGETYTASAWAMATAGTWDLRLTSTNNNNDPIALAPIAADGVWNRLGGTFVAAFPELYLGIRKSGTTGAASAGMTGVLIEQGARMGNYFDGSFAPSVIDGRERTYAWAGAEHGSPSVELYRPDVFMPTVPSEYRLAQVMQARNLYNAGLAGPSGANDGSSFGLTTFPLDWQVQQLLRPRRGMGVIL